MLVSTFLEYRRITYICTRVRTIPVNTISHICTRALRRIIAIPIFKRGCVVGLVSNPVSKINLVSNDWSDDQAEKAIVVNQGRSENNKNKRQGLHDEQYFIVFIHAFRCGLDILKKYSCLIMRISFPKAEKDKVHGKNTPGKERQKKLHVFGEKGRNNHSQNTSQSGDNFERMRMLVVFKLLKKPVHLGLWMVVLRHYYSLKSLINCTYSIAFPTNHTK
jgi:hypothetical protein